MYTNIIADPNRLILNISITKSNFNIVTKIYFTKKKYLRLNISSFKYIFYLQVYIVIFSKKEQNKTKQNKIK